MENIESRMIELTIVISILSFLPSFILLILNIIDRAKLSRINSFEEFKEKMRILAIRKWLKRGATLTIGEIIKEFMKMEEKLKKSKITRFLFIVMPPFIYFSFYASLVDNIGYYYLKLKRGYEIPQEEYFKEYILGDVVALVLLSLWIALVLFRKLAIYRINMFLKKFKEFQDALNKGKQKVDNFDE